MNGKIFSLDDANRLLPLVRAVTRDAMRHYAAAKQAIDRLEALKRRRDAGSEDAARGLALQDDAIARHLRELRRLIDEVEALGCHLRDYERGIVDFPAACLDEGGFVYYCWSIGEDRVTHWHSDAEGFEARRLVGAP